MRPAEPCDLESCVCAEQDLSILAGRAFHTAVDAEGYIYQFAICGALPADALPSGCAGGSAAKGAAVVKYKEDQDADCSEVLRSLPRVVTWPASQADFCGPRVGQLGSVGPCGAGERCGLTAEWTDDASGYATTLLLHYAYTTWAGGHGRAVVSPMLQYARRDELDLVPADQPLANKAQPWTPLGHRTGSRWR